MYRWPSRYLQATVPVDLDFPRGKKLNYKLEDLTVVKCVRFSAVFLLVIVLKGQEPESAEIQGEITAGRSCRPFRLASA
jgi:hypothetical protein